MWCLGTGISGRLDSARVTVGLDVFSSWKRHLAFGRLVVGLEVFSDLNDSMILKSHAG